MAATVQAQISVGAGPTITNAETGITFGRDDTQVSTTPVPVPTAAGTNRSWYKTIHLQVTGGGGSTSISNRRISWATAPGTGMTGYFKDGGASYVQATGVNKPPDDASVNDSTPATYTALTTTPQVWHVTSAAAVNATRNGNYCLVAAGLSFLFAGGGGSNTLPNIVTTYDEA